MWFYYLPAIALALVIGLTVYSVAPRRKRDTSPFDRTLYAHRGLHNNENGHPENSLAAFAAAAEAGYGVELDIQFTADRQIVVFHDNDLMRMCNVDRRVNELTYSELKEYRLLNSDQHIPLLSEALETLDGATVLCELKPGKPYIDTSLCAAAAPLLDDYKGAVCIESFNPFMVHWFRRHAPHRIRGILSKKYTSNEVAPILRFPLSSLLANWLCRPDFIAYQHADYKQPFFRLCRLFRPMTVAWTVCSTTERDEAHKRFDTVIFEGFLPTDSD